MSLLLSLKDLRQQHKKNTFVGRENEIDVFEHMLDKGESHTAPILNIYGIGGIGKSTLLQKYFWLCKKNDIVYASVDGRDERIKIGIVNGQVLCNLPELLQIWRNQLDTDRKSKNFNVFDNYIERFNKTIKKYWAGDRANIPGLDLMENFSGNATGGLIGASIGGFPGVILGAAIGSAAQKLANAIGRTSHILKSAGLTNDEIEFCLNIEKNLAKSFVKGVNKLCVQHGRLVLFIDTFEMIESFQRWLVNIFFNTDININVRFVIAGRELLNKAIWNEWKYLIHEFELEPFSKEIVSQFLAKHGIDNNNTLKKVQQVSNGVPWAMALLTENLTIMDGDWQAVLEKGLPYEISKQMVERFLDQIQDEKERLFIEICAIPLSFDVDLIETIMAEQFPGMTAWRKIMQYSFFGTLPSGRNFMLNPLREFIVDLLKVERPLRLEQWNSRACKYYQKAISFSEKRLEGFIWEYLYHSFFMDIEACAFFLPKRDYIDRIAIEVPKLDDVKRILEVDGLTMGTDPEILYDEDRIRLYLERDVSMFRVAVDRESGRVAGYSLTIAPHEDWCKKFEAKEKPRIHLHEFLKLREIGEFGDYMIDTIAVLDLRDRITSAMLIRAIIPILAVRPRKFYIQAVTEFGVEISNKLGMNYLTTRYTKQGSPMQCFYLCLYDNTQNGPLYSVLEKYRPNKSLERACKGCRISECKNYSQYGKVQFGKK